MPSINMIDSHGRQINHIAMIQRDYYFKCKGVCGRKHVHSYAANAKYCLLPLCQEKKRNDSDVRRKLLRDARRRKA